MVTTYTLDLAAGLTQVLADGSFTYLYGNGRVAQVTVTETKYFLGDALGSVRQLTDEAAEVTLARRYEPYGDVLNSMGPGTTSYGFTGELLDSYIKLLYLRARWLDTETGRFLSKDTWRDYSRPLSLNGWSYVEGDPIGRVDPSGRSWNHPTKAEGILIHQMIATHFRAWGTSGGRSVGTEVLVNSASKELALRLKNDDGITLVFAADVIDPPNGFADLVDFTARQVYEIKHIPSLPYAVAEAEWYRGHLNRDVDLSVYGPWYLGIEYLADRGQYGAYIGLWPNDPDHVVRAKWAAPGAIVYWGSEPRRLNQTDLAKYEVAVAVAFGAGVAAAEIVGKIKGREPRVRGPQPRMADYGLEGYVISCIEWWNLLLSPVGP